MMVYGRIQKFSGLLAGRGVLGRGDICGAALFGAYYGYGRDRCKDGGSKGCYSADHGGPGSVGDY